MPKRQTRLEGFDEKVLAMYARGMTVRDIESQLKDIYSTEVSPTLISIVTDAVMDEASALWGLLLEQPFWSTQVIMSWSLLSLNLQRY
ncbi:MAG: transposase [Candidatus Obscuribacterales bacterium]|nr:transposase [Candidatus Obscuribacterales bacterium]